MAKKTGKMPAVGYKASKANKTSPRKAPKAKMPFGASGPRG